MSGAGRLGDKASIQQDAHGCPGCPHPGVGPGVSGSPNVLINGLPALRKDDVGIHAVCCGANMWSAADGSPTVFINGKAAFRKDDPTRHCGGQGKLIEGSADVLIGGASSGGGGGGGGSASDSSAASGAVAHHGHGSGTGGGAGSGSSHGGGHGHGSSGGSGASSTSGTAAPSPAATPAAGPVSVHLDHAPARFAPSAENCRIDYTITAGSTAPTSARLEIQDRHGTTVVTRTGLAFATGTHSVSWDGRLTSGAWAQPADSPFTAVIHVDPGSVSNSASIAVEVASVEITHTPAATATPLRVYKPSTSATRIDKELQVTVKLRNSGGSAVVTQVPIRVDWSFTAHGDNAPKAQGGRDDTDAHFAAVSGHALSGGLLVDANGTTNTSGVLRVTFILSAIAGDRFTVHARVLRDPAAPAGGNLGHADSPRFEVWKQLNYSNLYRMRMSSGTDGVDIGSYAHQSDIQPAFTPCFTEVTIGAVHDVTVTSEYLTPLVLPTAAQLPAKSAVRVRSDGADTRTVTVSGIVVAADGTTSDGHEAVTLAGTGWVATAAQFQKVTTVTTSADPARTVEVQEATGANRPIATLAPHHASASANFLFDTAASVQTKAQAWADANENNQGPTARSFEGTLAAGHKLVGGIYLSPKHDGRASTAATTYYRGYPSVRITIEGRSFHPDGQWNNFDGQNTGTMAVVFLNMRAGHNYRRMVCRHEIAHACDHVSFGSGDHCPRSTCLMFADSTGDEFCTHSPEHSRHHVMGWT